MEEVKRILLLEPYYTGSHKLWCDQLVKYSRHRFHLITLPGRHWKWRMHGAAITLANRVKSLKFVPDTVLISSMLDLPLLRALMGDSYQGVKWIAYFHENQFAYPVSELDSDEENQRDNHYGWINYTSALVSDLAVFNSNYNLDTLLDGMTELLGKLPDFQNEETIDQIRNKSLVLPVGVAVSDIMAGADGKTRNETPVIVWNHRWEYDKNPDDFFDLMDLVKKQGIDFKLVVLGEKSRRYPIVFDEVKDRFADELLHLGYCRNYDDYVNWLVASDILLVTSNHDFFGLSVVEAISAKCHPLLPERLAYPEHFSITENPDCFYTDLADATRKLTGLLCGDIQMRNLSLNMTKYELSSNINNYDKIL